MTGDSSPQRILIIRLHAFGDLIAILPYVNKLRKDFPEARIDLLTTERVQTIPAYTGIFNRIYGLKGKMNAKLVLLSALWHAPRIAWERYNQIIDLQDNRASRYVQYIAGHSPSNTFDRLGPYFAGTRYQKAIEQLGFNAEPEFKLPLKSMPSVMDKLKAAGRQPQEKLIILNPAGYFPSRQWPLSNYEQTIELLSKQYSTPHKILLLGDDRIAEKSTALQQRFPERVINLVGKTTQLEAFLTLGQASLVVSEDSGLAHMTWVQGVPLILMLGSTRADWTAPPFPHVVNLTSSDLECGDCMQAHCQFGDNRCLTRYQPQQIVDLILKRLSSTATH